MPVKDDTTGRLAKGHLEGAIPFGQRGNMRNKEVIKVLEQWAPPALQEEYDNIGLQVGDPEASPGSALITLDCTEEVVAEAVRRKCGLIITHHPVIFKGLRSLTGASAVERTLLAAIRAGVAIHAIHTNLDNVLDGVNGEMARTLGLKPLRVLDPRNDQLRKLVVFVPHAHSEAVRDALFTAGAGQLGRYDECSFNSTGSGTFRAGEGVSLSWVCKAPGTGRRKCGWRSLFRRHWSMPYWRPCGRCTRMKNRPGTFTRWPTATPASARGSWGNGRRPA
jgi:putative NIF3 family GTP cyclohydrolase 1 type 2